MKIKTGMTRKYEDEKQFQLNRADPLHEVYIRYIFDKTEEWAERMERIIYENDELTEDNIQTTLNSIDDGMSAYQYEVILYLLKKYWFFSAYLDEVNS